MGKFEVLQDELANDPLSRGYAGMTDQQILDDLNTVYRDHWLNLRSAEIFEAIDPTEFTGLSAAQQARVDRILGLGEGIATAPGAQARTEIIAVFGGGSTTVSTLATLANQQRSRAEELSIASYIILPRIAAARP